MWLAPLNAVVLASVQRRVPNAAWCLCVVWASPHRVGYSPGPLLHWSARIRRIAGRSGALAVSIRLLWTRSVADYLGRRKFPGPCHRAARSRPDCLAPGWIPRVLTARCHHHCAWGPNCATRCRRWLTTALCARRDPAMTPHPGSLPSCPARWRAPLRCRYRPQGQKLWCGWMIDRCRCCWTAARCSIRHRRRLNCRCGSVHCHDRSRRATDDLGYRCRHRDLGRRAPRRWRRCWPPHQRSTAHPVHRRWPAFPPHCRQPLLCIR